MTGCATKYLAPDEKIGPQTLDEKTGVLFGSFARDPSAPKYTSQRFWFKNMVTGQIHEIQAQPTFNAFTGRTPDDFNTDRSVGAVFAFALPAGRYTFFNFRLYSSNGFAQNNWYSKEDYSIPFDVHPNKTSYVGEIKLVPAVGKNIFGMTLLAGGVWVISDQKSRDSELLAGRYPRVPIKDVTSVIPMEKERFTPLVILPSEVKQNAIISASR